MLSGQKGTKRDWGSLLVKEILNCAYTIQKLQNEKLQGKTKEEENNNNNNNKER